MKMPFPDINSQLAVQSHMYICYNRNTNDYELVKCQTFKNRFYNLNHKIIESKDINRNPFNHKTLIDCDKLFRLQQVTIPDTLLTTTRRDICEELFNNVAVELQTDSFEIEVMDNIKVKSVNPDIS